MADKNLHITKNSSFPPSDWVETSLGEVSQIIPGFAFKSSDFGQIGFPVVKITEIKPPYIDFSNSQKVNLKNYDLQKLEKYKLQKGDFLIAMTWATIGKVGKIIDDSIGYLNQRVAKITNIENLSNKKFIYYLISLPDFISFVKKFAFGAVQANISTTEIGNFPILLPPLPEQKAIASVLSSFDDKIELLKEENKTLEEMGQTIFKEWFGKYKIGDKLPDGWRVGKLGEISSLKSGFAFGGNDFVEKSNTMVLKIKNLKGNWIIDLSDISFVKDELKKLDKVQYFKLNTGDIVLAMSWNTTWKIGIIPNLKDELFLNQRVGKFFLDDEKFKTFIYFFLMSGKYEEKILAMGYGSAQPNINPTQIENIKIIYPDSETLKSFINSTNPIFTKILDNLSQIQSLTRTRDLLLPKLMRGELRVKF